MQTSPRTSGNSPKVALITGGTKGLGLAVGKRFARAGVRPVLTYRWGSAPEAEVEAEFRREGLMAPWLIAADVGEHDETVALFRQLAEARVELFAFVSNVACAALVRDFSDLKKRSLFNSIEYSSWPLIDYLQTSLEILDVLPRYTVAISSEGAERYHDNYDFAAANKAILETFVRYLACRLAPHGVTINAVRPLYYRSDSAQSTFGSAELAVFDKVAEALRFPSPAALADAVYGLCSGHFDAVNGQIITVDNGGGFKNSTMGLVTVPELRELFEHLTGKQGDRHEPE